MSRNVSVRLLFGESIVERNGKHHVREIKVASDGSDSILDIKKRLAVRTARCQGPTALPGMWEAQAAVTHATFSLVVLQVAFGGKVSSDDFRLSFGPNDRKIGQQYRSDPSVDESQLKLQQFSVLSWLDKFPHWHLTARPIQQTPPPPGVAIKKAAASAEGKDPEKAVIEARTKVRIMLAWNNLLLSSQEDKQQQ